MFVLYSNENKFLRLFNLKEKKAIERLIDKIRQNDAIQIELDKEKV